VEAASDSNSLRFFATCARGIYQRSPAESDSYNESQAAGLDGQVGPPTLWRAFFLRVFQHN